MSDGRTLPIPGASIEAALAKPKVDHALRERLVLALVGTIENGDPNVLVADAKVLEAYITATAEDTKP